MKEWHISRLSVDDFFRGSALLSTSNRSSACLLIATCAAMIFLLSLIKIHFSHSQSFHWQNLLWPFNTVRTPWYLQRAQRGAFFGDNSGDLCSTGIIMVAIRKRNNEKLLFCHLRNFLSRLFSKTENLSQCYGHSSKTNATLTKRRQIVSRQFFITSTFVYYKGTHLLMTWCGTFILLLLRWNFKSKFGNIWKPSLQVSVENPLFLTYNKQFMKAR